MSQSLLFYMFLIFTGASLLATVALFTRQSLLVAYIVLGAILGPWGLQWVNDPELIMHMSDIGIIFLLFLLGLNLDPKNLIHLLKNTVVVTLLSSLAFGAFGYFLGQWFSFNRAESLVIATSMMFSSTIIGLKLLPTTILHHQRTGEIVISILLLQDIIAIAAMMLLEAYGGSGGLSARKALVMLLGLPGITLFSFLAERYILIVLIQKFDRIKEYIFLVAIGWCLGIAELAHALGLSHEIGAFIAGVAIATSPISLYIAESLKPLRDFFLVLFFFSLGAGLNFSVLGSVAVPAILLAVIMLVIKPGVFWGLLRQTHETDKRALEIGVRLGQISEFSLLVAYLAKVNEVIGDSAYYLIQAATILSFIISSYLITAFYPTPISMSDKLRRD
jgi:Kef-type K+ transport system membrane component KefB